MWDFIPIIQDAWMRHAVLMVPVDIVLIKHLN